MISSFLRRAGVLILSAAIASSASLADGGMGPGPGNSSHPTGGGTSVFSIYTNHSGPSINGQGVGWANDFSSGSGSINGSNTTNLFPGHSFNLLVSANEAYQPAASWIAGFPVGTQSNVGPAGYNLGSFATGTPNIQDGPFTDIVVGLWTANPSHDFLTDVHSMGFFSQGFADTVSPAGTQIGDITQIPGASALVGSTWQTVTIPLPFLGSLGLLSFYKIEFKDNGLGAYQIDNFGFKQGSYSWVINGGLPNGYSNNQTFNATALIAGQNYVINSVGTTSWTSIGAASNTGGLQFFATSAGTGTGTATGNFWNYDANTPLNGWADASINATPDYSFNPTVLESALGNQGGNFGVTGHKTPGYGVGATFTTSGTSVTFSNLNGIPQLGMILQANGLTGFPRLISGSGTSWTLSFAPNNVTNQTCALFSSTAIAKIANSAANATWKVTQASFALAGFTRFTFAVLPTSGTHSWSVSFCDTSGAATGSAVTIAASSKTYTVNDNQTTGYTPYVVPLSAFGSLPSNIGCISIQDTSGLSSNVWYLGAVAFMS